MLRVASEELQRDILDARHLSRDGGGFLFLRYPGSVPTSSFRWGRFGRRQGTLGAKSLGPGKEFFPVSFTKRM